MLGTSSVATMVPSHSMPLASTVDPATNELLMYPLVPVWVGPGTTMGVLSRQSAVAIWVGVQAVTAAATAKTKTADRNGRTLFTSSSPTVAFEGSHLRGVAW